jgi:DNA-binding transcriptional MerR regulator
MSDITNHPVELPDKFYFKVGEVSQIAGIPAYVLRFWESEFKEIQPKRTDSGQRLYRKKDIEKILTIKHLLYEKRFTIQGAKQALKSPDSRTQVKKPTVTYSEIRKELIHIRTLLTK